MTKQLYLLDAMALIYRGYFAMAHSQRVTSKGFNTSAIFGFTNALYEIMHNHEMTHVAICFDSNAPTFRHEEYSDYKAGREPIPDDIVSNLPYIRMMLNALNIKIVEKPGFEADDLIGTLATKAGQTGEFKVVVVTPDKDLCQIVDENISILKPAHGKTPAEILDVKAVNEKFGVKNPKQVIDYLGLVGDTSDNIPGVKGIGPVAAKKLLSEFDTIENIISNIQKIKNDNVRKKLEENIENATFSKFLATIDTNVECVENLDELIVRQPDVDAVKAICNELELRMFEKRFITDMSLKNLRPTSDTSGKSSSQTEKKFIPDNDIKKNKRAPESLDLGLFSNDMMKSMEKNSLNTIHNTEHEYIYVETDDDMADLLKTLRQADVIGFDTETTDLNANDGSLVGMSFSVKPHKAYFVHFNGSDHDTKNTLTRFVEIFSDKKKKIVGQNLKFDILVLSWYGMEIQAAMFDTMIAHYLINPEGRHNMDDLSEQYLHYTPVHIEELIGAKGMQQGNMRNVDKHLLTEYACEDADVTLQLYHKLDEEIEKSGYRDLFEKVEMPLVPVLAKMEHDGVKIDNVFLEDYSKKLQEEIGAYETRIYEYAGRKFNIASPRQLGEILFDVLKLSDKPKKTKSGQYATGEEILQKMEFVHPIIASILDYRSTTKLLTTYVEPFPLLISRRDGRLHTTFNQAVVATGRLSSNNPNLQNIPIRTARGREIRKAFVPSDNNHVIVSADYSQIELRIIAHIANDPTMIKAFNDGMDIHTSTAAEIFGVDFRDVTADMRRMAKTVNFGIIYGMSSFGLAERLQISRPKASELIKQYFGKYGAIKQYMTDTVNFAKEHGFVETLLGRRRYIPDIYSANATVRGYAERNAINAPIQGSSADMIKIAMINIFKQLKINNLQSKMVIQVHDELVFDAVKSELPVLEQIIDNEMRNAVKLNVPVDVAIGTGANWLEAH